MLQQQQLQVLLLLELITKLQLLAIQVLQVIGAANNNVGTIFAATGVGSGTGTAFIEKVPWILGTEFEATLYATCQVASIYLGDVEMEAKFDALTQRKLDALNQKEIRASMKGSAFSAQFSTPLL